MRTSRVSKETAKLVDILSAAPRRQSQRIAEANPPLNHYARTDRRRKKELASHHSSSIIKDEPQSDGHDSSVLSSANTTDIEDLLTPARAMKQERKRKRGLDSLSNVEIKRPTSPARNTPSRRISSTAQKKPIVVKKEEIEPKPTPNPKPRRLPARRSIATNGVVKVEPPSNWEKIYEIVKEMRRKNPTAPVDTMGCSQLYWRSSSPRDRRFHILIALMLSSQTKDTVTAIAMQRLHTELAPEQDNTDTDLGGRVVKKEEEVGHSIKEEDVVSIKKEEEKLQVMKKEEEGRHTIKKEEGEEEEEKREETIKSEEQRAVKVEAEAEEEQETKKVLVWDRNNQQTKSTLTLENILAVTPARLNKLIQTVGFHNNKTKYIKAAAVMLRDEYNSDIPPTPEGLMRLPGVGPKMAYLCMSSAWGRDEGIGVDVHVHRITNLWGWHKTKTPEETRAALESWLPRDKWHEINKLLVGLGQTVCLPVARRCGECELAETGLCKSEIKGWTAKVKKERKVKTEVEAAVVKRESKIRIKIEEDR
ncbi:endonuclease III [[Emmonsia] crescens]|uniref:Endonuclease III homolog n=1 Tax=[Emmonsia] crescens TaxID=73230 RepID=A0A2B7ZRI1_9EURO|nr:endonuclease III [Emmonsia crescens]